MQKITISSYAQAREIADAAEQTHKDAGALLRSLPRLDNGLTPDHVRATSEWQDAKHKADAAFSALQRINQIIMRHYKREYMAERAARLTAKNAPTAPLS